MGGNTDLSCHLFENNHLTLMPIIIGRGTLVGAHCYNSPGVTIGESCVVGLYSYIRTGHAILDRSVITFVGAIDILTSRKLEQGRLASHLREWCEAKRASR